MRARLLLGVAAVASAFVLPGTSSAIDTCVGASPQLAVCIDQECYDPHCTLPQFTVYGQCSHPVPLAGCALVAFRLRVLP